MVLAMLQTAPLPAQAAGNVTDITVSPASIRPGGTVAVNAFNLTAGAAYQVGLASGGSYINPVSVTANARGQVSTRVPIPVGTAAGGYVVGVGVYSGGAFERQAALTVQNGISIALDKSHARPGETVSYTLGGLTTGTVQLTLAGLPVGQFNASASAASGSFIAPNPDLVGPVTFKVTLLNNARGMVAGISQTSFTLDAPLAPPTPVISGLVITPNPVMPGQSFTIDGTLWPLPEELASGGVKDAQSMLAAGSGFLVNLVDGGGHFSDAGATLETFNSSNGSFRLRGIAPSILNGAPISMRASMTAEVKLITRKEKLTANAGANGPLNLQLHIRTVDKTGSPIGGIRVVATDISKGDAASLSSVTPTAPALEALICGELALTQPGDGRLSLDVNFDDQTLTHPLEEMFTSSSLYNQSINVVEPLAAADSQAAATAWQPPGWPADSWAQIKVLANGLSNNYSYYTPSNPWTPGSPLKIYRATLWFDKIHGNVYDINGNLINTTNDMELAFEYVGQEEAGPEVAMTLTHGIRLGEDPVLRGPEYIGFFDLSAFGYSEKLGFPATFGVQFALDTDKWSPVSASVAVDGQIAAVQSLTESSSTPLCGVHDSSGPSQAAAGIQQYLIKMPFPAHYSTGRHLMEVRVYLAGGSSFVRRLAFFVNETPSWVLNPNYAYKSVLYGTDMYTFSATALSPSQNAYGKGENQASVNIPETGPLNNEVKPNAKIIQKIRPSATSQGEVIPSSADSSAKAEGTQAMSNKPSTQEPAKVQDPTDPLVVDIPAVTEQLAKISIPLFVTAFADPYGGAIVSGTAGANMESSASVTTSGKISPSYVEFTISPTASVGIRMWLNVNVLYGILARAKLAITPSFGLTMPVIYRNPGGMDTQDVCFSYRADVYYYFGFLCVPILGCAYEHEGNSNIYNDERPDGCPHGLLAQKAYGPQAEQDPAALLAQGGPIFMDMGLTSDPKGKTLGIFQLEDSRGALNIRTLEDGAWSAPLSLTTSPTGGNNPAITVLSDHLTLAAWTASGYATDTVPAPTLTAVAQSQYIEYAFIENNIPGPYATLTAPFSGDGQVSLEACPYHEAACPSGGAATAAWQRMKTSDPYKGGTRIHYRTFMSGLWQAEAAIPAPASSSDAQAQVFYQGTQATIAFVRDADGSGFTTADRRLYFYTLGEASATLVDEIPAGVVEFTVEVDDEGTPHIAFTLIDGANIGLLDNRHALYGGVQTCSGTCTWEIEKLVDSHGRAIYAESPVLTIDPQNNMRVAYRALGMSADTLGSHEPYLEDTIGVVNQTGDLAVFNLSSNHHAPLYLTSDGAVNWGVRAIYDQNSGAHVVLAVRTASLAQDARQSAPRLVQSLDAGSPIVFSIQSSLPNFVIDAVTPHFTSLYDYGDAETLTVTLRNAGDSWTMSADQPLTAAAAWDAPYGQSPLAGKATLTALLSGQVSTLTLDMSMPPLGTRDISHVLYLTLIPPDNSPETSLLDNSFSVELGGLPAPQGVHVMGQGGFAPPLITWDAVEEYQISGYHIYRAEGNGPFKIVGVTASTQWLDGSAQFDTLYTYAVSAYNANGESPLSIVTAIQPQRFRLMFPLVLRQ